MIDTKECFTHFPLIFLNLILITFTFFSFKTLKIKSLKDNGKINMIPVVGLSVYFFLFILTSLLSKCNLCIFMIILNLISFVFVLVLFLRDKAPKEKIDKKEKIDISDSEVRNTIGKPVPLKDAFGLATKINNENLVVNKKMVSEWVIKNFPNKINVNINDKNTSDSFFVNTNNGTSCMALIYEVKGKNIFILARMSQKMANDISIYHTTSKSLYPKTTNSDWYLLLIDESYHNIQEIYDVIVMIYQDFMKNNVKF